LEKQTPAGNGLCLKGIAGLIIDKRGLQLKSILSDRKINCSLSRKDAKRRGHQRDVEIDTHHDAEMQRSAQKKSRTLFSGCGIF
jgi:hypothetical protein